MTNEKNLPENSRPIDEITRVQTIEVGAHMDAHKMQVWHSMAAQFAQSREIRNELKHTIRLKVKAQHELLKQEIGTRLDVEKKVMFDQYLSNVTQLEHQFIQKMDALDHQNDEYEQNIREEYYTFFDSAREKIKKWEKKSDRYKAEVERLDRQEQKRLEGVRKRLEQVEKKRENILEQTLKIFDSSYGIEVLKKKLNIY